MGYYASAACKVTGNPPSKVAGLSLPDVHILELNCSHFLFFISNNHYMYWVTRLVIRTSIYQSRVILKHAFIIRKCRESILSSFVYSKTTKRNVVMFFPSCTFYISITPKPDPQLRFKSFGMFPVRTQASLLIKLSFQGQWPMQLKHLRDNSDLI